MWETTPAYERRKTYCHHTLGQKNQDAYRTSTDYARDVYMQCGFYSSWPCNHKRHLARRTIRAGDVWFVMSLLTRITKITDHNHKMRFAHRPIRFTIVATKYCAISAPAYLTKSIIIREYLNLGKLWISFFRTERIPTKFRYFAQIQLLTYDDALR